MLYEPCHIFRLGRLSPACVQHANAETLLPTNNNLWNKMSINMLYKPGIRGKEIDKWISPNMNT